MIRFAQLLPRLKASGVHLCISLAVALAAAALIFLVWYPAPLSEAQGVSRLVLVLIGVDVAIGPLITLFVFNRAKKSLRMDLTIVACLQLAALLYGLHSIFIARPAIVAFNIDRFDVVPALDVDQVSLDKARAAGKPGLPWWGPRIVVALLPTDREERNSLLFSAAGGGPDLPQMAQWYEPYAAVVREEVIKQIRPLPELREVNHLDPSAWDALLASLGRPESEIGYLPLSAKVKDGAVIVDVKTAAILKIILLQPKWR